MCITTRARLCCGALLSMLCAAALADNAMTTESADLYAGPDSSYPVVAQLDSNTPIEVMGCLDDWSWCDVGAGDVRGWMYSPDIIYAYQDGYVPLYSYAPALSIAVVPFVVDDYWGRYYHDRPWYPRREEWAHRVIQHRRPPGPPPSASLPPRPQRRGEPARPDVERHDAERRGTAGEDRNTPRPPPAPQRPQPRVMPPAPNPQQHQAPREAPHEAPHEDRAHPNPGPPRAAPPPGRPDHQRPEPPAPPKREENPH